MKRWIVPATLAVVIGLGSYAIFAQQTADQPQQGTMGGGRGGGMMQQGGGMMGGGMMGRGMMRQGAGGMSCPGCAVACGAMMQESVTATNDGGVVVAVAGKLIKYDAALKKVSEANIDIDWSAIHQRVQQMMQNCPMAQQMMRQPQGQQTQQTP
jgi:hypothetical protein